MGGGETTLRGGRGVGRMITMGASQPNTDSGASPLNFLDLGEKIRLDFFVLGAPQRRRESSGVAQREAKKTKNNNTPTAMNLNFHFHLSVPPMSTSMPSSRFNLERREFLVWEAKYSDSLSTHPAGGRYGTSLRSQHILLRLARDTNLHHTPYTLG